MLSAIISGFLTFLITFSIIPILKKFFLIEPIKRSSHNIPKPTAGGVVFVSLISLNGILNQHYIPLFCIPLSIIGLLDDKFDLKPNSRLIAQILTIIFLISISPLNNILLNSFGNYFYILFLLGLIFVSAGCINFINFADGLDGLLAGCMSIILATISIYFELNFWPYVACLIGFLFLNWYPSKLFMGDVGSTFLGALFLGIILQTDNFVDAIKILLLASPLLGDSLITLTRRLISGESILVPHKSFYFKRLNQGQLSHKQVSIIYILATTLICIALLFGDLKLMIALIFLELLILLILERKYAVKYD